MSAFPRARSAINAAQTQEFDLAIVDLRLPDLHGSALIRNLRRSGHQFPILAITALPAINERVAALDSGANDYLTKPFSVDDLESRIRVLLRRARPDHSPGPIRIGSLVLVPGDPRVLIDNRAIFLTPKELIVLEVLARSVGELVPTNALALELSRTTKPVTDAAVSIHIHRLRSRLQSAGVQIRTLRGFGYLLEKV